MIESKFSLANASIGNKESTLAEIHLANKNISIYEREISALQPEIKQVLNQSVDFSISGDVQKIETALKTYFSTHFSDCLTLLEDIRKLLDLFNNVTKASSYRLLLATVNTNMCRRFHTDINDLRMLCTYRGQGTLWLTEDNINRSALDSSKDNEYIVINENKIQQVSTGSVALLKGAIYPKEGTRAIVHRSPTIEESGEKRLLLRIDTNDFLSFLNDDATNN